MVALIRHERFTLVDTRYAPTSLDVFVSYVLQLLLTSD